MYRPLATLSSLALLALLACSPTAPPPAPTGNQAPVTGSATTGEQRADKQDLKVGSSQVPATATMAGALTVYQYQLWPLYDTLTIFGPGFAVKPQLAEKWEVSADGLTWTFSIRKDVSFSNGDKLTAKDVLSTLDNVVSMKWPQQSTVGSLIKREVTDDYTLKLTTAVPDLAVPNYGTSWFIQPKDYFDKVGLEGFIQKPIGSGPYVLAEQKIGDNYLYKKRPEKHPFRNAQADSFYLKLIADATTLVTAAKTGEIDFFTSSVDAVQADALKAAGLNVQAVEIAEFVLVMAQNIYEQNNTPLKDKRVRDAINYAVDKETIGKAIFKGYSRPAGQYGTPGSPWWDDSVQAYPFDQKKAKELLAAAGYTNGFKIKADINTATPQAMALAVQGNLKDVGIDVELVSNDPALYLDKYFGRTGRSDMFILSPGETNGFFSSIRNAFTCKPPAGASLGFYCNQDFDTTLNKAFVESDSVKRAQNYKDANKIMRGDTTALYLTTAVTYNVSNAKLKGIEFATPTVFIFDPLYFIK